MPSERLRKGRLDPFAMLSVSAKPPFVMARQTSLHHRSNQTRNRHGWRCLAERKLRLRVRQYAERYPWFETDCASDEGRRLAQARSAASPHFCVSGWSRSSAASRPHYEA